MLNLTRKFQTCLALVVLCICGAPLIAEETAAAPGQPSVVEHVVVSDSLPSADAAEPGMAAEEVTSMIEDEVLLDLNSRLIAAAPSS